MQTTMNRLVAMLTQALILLSLAGCVALLPVQVEPAAVPSADGIFIDERTASAITLPNEWTLLPMSAEYGTELQEALGEYIADGGADAEFSIQWAEQFTQTDVNGLEFVALRDGPTSAVLTMTAVEGHGLTLPQYLEAMKGALPATATVNDAILDYTGEQAVLTAILRFTQPAGAQKPDTVYIQYARLSEDGQNLLLLNLAAPAQDAEEVITELEPIVESWQTGK